VPLDARSLGPVSLHGVLVAVGVHPLIGSVGVVVVWSLVSGPVSTLVDREPEAIESAPWSLAPGVVGPPNTETLAEPYPRGATSCNKSTWRVEADHRFCSQLSVLDR
jgi:hypothetical protein